MEELISKEFQGSDEGKLRQLMWGDSQPSLHRSSDRLPAMEDALSKKIQGSDKGQLRKLLGPVISAVDDELNRSYNRRTVEAKTKEKMMEAKGKTIMELMQEIEKLKQENGELKQEKREALQRATKAEDALRDHPFKSELAQEVARMKAEGKANSELLGLTNELLRSIASIVESLSESQREPSADAESTMRPTKVDGQFDAPEEVSETVASALPRSSRKRQRCGTGTGSRKAEEDKAHRRWIAPGIPAASKPFFNPLSR